MELEEYEDLVYQFKRVRMARRPYYYWFCPKAKEDDLPLLFIEKKEAPLKKRAREARKRAKIKMYAMGQVWRSSDGLIFCNELKLDPKKMEKLFKTRLATQEELKKIATHLRRAEVLTLDEVEARFGEEGPPELDDLGPDEDTHEVDEDTGELTKTFKEKWAEAKRVFIEARDVLGANADAVRTLAAHRRLVEQAVRGKDLKKAVQLLEELIEQGHDTVKAALEQAWDERLALAKKSFDEAKKKFAGKGQTFKDLDGMRKWAIEARKAGKFDVGVDRLNQLIEACEEALHAQDEDRGDELELDWDVELDYRTGLARDLLARWREAQVESGKELAKFKRAALSMPGVSADPRYLLIEEALKKYDPTPDWGDALEKALAGLTRAMNAKHWELRAKKVLPMTKKHRAMLRARPELKNIDTMLSKKVRVRAALMEALYGIDQVIKEVH